MKNQTLRISLLACTAAFGLAACGDTVEKIGEKIGQGADLQGEYSTAIREEISLKVGGVGCVLNTIDITTNQYDYTQDIYADKDCNQELLGTIKIETAMTIGEPLAEDTSIRALNLKIQSAKIISKSEKLGEVLGVDTTGECNLDQLKVNEERDVAGLNCVAFGEFPAKDHVYFTGYKFDGEDLLLASLPHELPKNVSPNEDNPAPRALSLTVRYKKK